MLDPALIIWSIVVVGFLITWRVEYKYFTKKEKEKKAEEIKRLEKTKGLALLEDQAWQRLWDEDE